MLWDRDVEDFLTQQEVYLDGRGRERNQERQQQNRILCLTQRPRTSFPELRLHAMVISKAQNVTKTQTQNSPRNVEPSLRPNRFVLSIAQADAEA